ncbi:CLUMA_CG019842, isoform A [Clunio marinus]|uniref:CLUMA_CG019842, isoform A n=1 Tax=Clunio marinus TaxID=568069 RepID=A0A1J1J3D3_9DIPT|nr:CLUMA_CG019842, isoform A [Clunio marinus]
MTPSSSGINFETFVVVAALLDHHFQLYQQVRISIQSEHSYFNIYHKPRHKNQLQCDARRLSKRNASSVDNSRRLIKTFHHAMTEKLAAKKRLSPFCIAIYDNA